MSETLLDVKGMNCPLPVLRANRALRSLAPGERLRVLATDRAAVADFQAFCRETGHALRGLGEEAGVFSFVIRTPRGGRPHEPVAADHPSGLPRARHRPLPPGMPGPPARRAAGAGAPRISTPLLREAGARGDASSSSLCAHPEAYVDAILAHAPGRGRDRSPSTRTP